ncbi:hypothetical protein [Streptomyces sp. Ag109_G2-15]|uniref:hypothetical protein n=1 Tax=Streptomyces sp. Ag109_G2-15 TaxID=1938850 RepID=UPI0015CF711E|nr:hypothetical protein [Streptomyces sp. Ag109_G2-15]
MSPFRPGRRRQRGRNAQAALRPGQEGEAAAVGCDDRQPQAGTPLRSRPVGAEPLERLVTGYESADGERWAKVGTARLSGLPRTVQVGLFATSPGDLTLRRVGLGGATEEVRLTQAGGVFDHVGLKGAASDRGG